MSTPLPKSLAVTVGLTLVTLLVHSAPAEARVLTLVDAVQTALDHQPQIRQTHANTDVSRARANETRAPILPQVNGTVSYLRETANPVLHPGFGTSPSVTCTAQLMMLGLCSTTAAMTTYPNLSSVNYFSTGVTLTQFIWDFGYTTDKWRASKATVDSTLDTELYTRNQILLNVRVAYFAARADTELLGVAKETLDNQNSHLKQVGAQVQVGARPQIDYVTQKAAVANAQYQLINAQNVLANAKVALNQAMGVEGPVDYDLDFDGMGDVAGEEGDIDALVAEAAQNRHDLRSLEDQVRGQRLLISSARGQYGPLLSGNAGVTDASTELSGLKTGWNLSVGATLTWNLFGGLLTFSQVQEQRANLVALEAQRDALHQQVYADVEQARLGVIAAKSSISAAEDALENTHEQLRLAEERYKQGIGNIVELSDAQLQLTSASAQKTQAMFNLALARAQLLRALGRVA